MTTPNPLTHTIIDRVLRWGATLPPPIQALLFAVIALAAATVSFHPTPSGIPSPLWLPAGLAVVIVLHRGPWFLLGLWLGCLVADLRADLPPMASALLEIGRVVEVMLVVATIRRWGGEGDPPTCLAGMLVMIGATLLVGCPIGAAISGAVLALSPGMTEVSFWARWGVWWLGDATGILLVAPMLLLRAFWLGFPGLTRAERGLGFFLGAAALTAVALPLARASSPLSQMGETLIHLGFPIVVATALWLEIAGATVVVAVIATLALLSDAQWIEQLSGREIADGAFQLQIHIMTLVITGLSLAAAMTDRRQATEAMKRSAVRLMAAERLAGIGWWHHRSGTREEAWSAGMFHILGLSPMSTTPSTRAFDALVHPDDLPTVARYRETLGSTADGDGIEVRLRVNDTERWLVCRHTIAPEVGSGYFGIVKDITSQKHQTQALYESEQRLRRIFEQSPIGIAVVAADLRFLEVNSALARITGYTVEELQTLRVHDITHPDDLSLSTENVPLLLDGRLDQLVTEKRYLRKDGAVVWSNLSVRVVRDEAGHPLYFVSMMEDTTERKRTEQALAKAKLVAEQNNLAKTRFLVATSHDLGQPLLAANLFLETLARRLSPLGEFEEIDRLRQALTGMNELLDVLLDLSQVDAGVVRAEPRDILLGRLLGDLARNWSDLAAARGLTLRTVPCSLVARSDPALLKRIVRNLLDNALKYTRTGRILIGCRRSGDIIRVQVWDTGIGITPDKLQAIFEEFYQVGNANRDRRRGLGMGLSIVDRLAEVLGHRLSVRSTPGRGSVFEIQVPLARQQHTRTASPLLMITPAATSTPAPLTPLAGAVAVIEDDPLVLSSLEAMLTAWNCQVVAAASAGEVLALLERRNTRPTLILADFCLADNWTGVQAIAWLRGQLGTPVPGVVLSGDISDQARVAIDTAGLRLIRKPITPETLRAVLEQYCREPA